MVVNAYFHSAVQIIIVSKDQACVCVGVRIVEFKNVPTVRDKICTREDPYVVRKIKLQTRTRKRLLKSVGKKQKREALQEQDEGKDSSSTRTSRAGG